MTCENVLFIRGPIDRILNYAAAVEDWPDLLPHYRAVDILSQTGTERTVRMQCTRWFGKIPWPCCWTAIQEVDREGRKIRYRHLAGPAKGMVVEWSIDPDGDAVRTAIKHDFNVRIPILGQIYADRIVGPLFVSAIAGQTLKTIKDVVEAEA